MALIPKLSHLAGDGYSYFYFLSVLAALTQPAAVALKSALNRLLSRPHHRTTALKDFSFQGVRQSRSCHAGISMSNLKKSSGETSTRSSGRRQDSWGGEVCLTIPIDIRRQIKEYGPRFFGNGIMLHTLKLSRESVDDLSARDIAMKIRKPMPVVSKETYINFCNGLEEIVASGKTESLRPFDPESGVLVTNLSRLPGEKLNFGSGPPDLIIPLTAEKNSAAILARGADLILRYAY